MAWIQDCWDHPGKSVYSKRLGRAIALNVLSARGRSLQLDREDRWPPWSVAHEVQGCVNKGLRTMPGVQLPCSALAGSCGRSSNSYRSSNSSCGCDEGDYAMLWSVLSSGASTLCRSQCPDTHVQ